MKRYIRAAIDKSLTFLDLMEAVSHIYQKKFPYSRCTVTLNSWYVPAIDVQCFLGKDYSDWYNGIEDNDVFLYRAQISFPELHDTQVQIEDTVPQECVISLNWAYSDIVTTSEDPDLYCDYYRIDEDSVSGDIATILSVWEEYVSHLYDVAVQLYTSGKLHPRKTSFYNVKEKLQLR